MLSLTCLVCSILVSWHLAFLLLIQFSDEQEHTSTDEEEESSGSEYETSLVNLSALDGYADYDKGCADGNYIRPLVH